MIDVLLHAPQIGACGFFVVWNMYLTNENVEQVVEAARLKGDNKIKISIPTHTTRWRELSHIHADIEVLTILVALDMSQVTDNLYHYRILF